MAESGWVAASGASICRAAAVWPSSTGSHPSPRAAARSRSSRIPRDLGSTPALQKLKLPPLKKTKTGYSTDVDVLTKLSLQHELPLEILTYRNLNKLKSTYIDALPRLVHPKTGRIHTSYNQTVTATGRLSSSDPNLPDRLV